MVTAEASYHRLYDHRTVAFLQDAGVTVEHVDLAEQGIHGNGHLMAVECNNADLAALLSAWLDRHDIRP